jgi:hypothetical protein
MFISVLKLIGLYNKHEGTKIESKESIQLVNGAALSSISKLIGVAVGMVSYPQINKMV